MDWLMNGLINEWICRWMNGCGRLINDVEMDDGWIAGGRLRGVSKKMGKQWKQWSEMWRGNEMIDVKSNWKMKNGVKHSEKEIKIRKIRKMRKWKRIYRIETLEKKDKSWRLMGRNEKQDKSWKLTNRCRFRKVEQSNEKKRKKGKMRKEDEKRMMKSCGFETLRG